MLALLQRQLAELLAVELDQVERVVDERPLPLLQLGEARAASIVEPAHLAVDDGVRALHGLRHVFRERGKPRGEVVAVPGNEPALAGVDVGERAIAVELHLEHPAGPARQLANGGCEHRRVLPRRGLAGLAVPPADEQPVLLLAVEVRRHQRPRPAQARAVQPHCQLAVSLLLEELVRAVVPDLDRAGAVLPLRDLAVEARVLERMVLDVDGQRAAAGLERHPFRHGPGEEHPVALEPEVVVEPAGVVALDDEDRRAGVRLAPEGLGRLPPVALALVRRELGFTSAGHGYEVYWRSEASKIASELLHLTGGRRS